MAKDLKLNIVLDAKAAAKQVKEIRAVVLASLDGVIDEMAAAFSIKNRGERTVAIQAAKAKLNALREGLI